MIQSRISWKWKKRPFTYVLTPDDVLNLGRAIQAEGPPQSAVLWTLIQRFAFLFSTGEYTSLTQFLKDYVQPINPDWYPNGHRHLALIKELEKAGKTKELQAEKSRALGRPAKGERKWEELSASVRHLVESTLTGNRPISRAPDAVHYWASRATPQMTPSEAKAHNQKLKPELTLLDVGAGFGPGVNVFFSGSASQHLKQLAFHKTASSGSVGAVLLVAGAGIGYALYRWLG